MKNYHELFSKIGRSNDACGEGKAFLIEAESGIGKSFFLSRTISKLRSKGYCIVRIHGKRTPGGGRLDCFYEGAWEALNQQNFNGSMWIELIHKYSSKLPGWATFVSPLIEAKNFKAIELVSKKAGFTFSKNSAPVAAEFLLAIANKRKILLVVDDLQWVDIGTWDFLSFLLDRINKFPWTIILSINSSVPPHTEIEALGEIIHSNFHDVRSFSSFHVLKPERWDENSIQLLVSDLCRVSSCSLSQEQAKSLCSITAGIPKYVEIVINTLLAEGYLVVEGNVVFGEGNWDELDIPHTLQDILMRELDILYRKIKDSRRALQVACVIGEEFTEEMVYEISQINQTYELLKNIEWHSKIIEDLHKSNKWKFLHTLNHRTIYQSIGTPVKNLHLQIAQYMCKETPNNHEAISYHFRLADDLYSAIEYELKSIEGMIEEALFYPAIIKSQRIQNELSIELTFNTEYLVQAKTLEGRAYFYLNKFNQAIEIFSDVIFKVNELTEALSYRWLGRCYLSMTTQKDFKRAVDYLNYAKLIYENNNLTSLLAEVLSELSVAYEHCTDFANTEVIYKLAEKAFISAKDEIGINRLYRRGGMVLDGELASVLIEKSAIRFKKWNSPHEEVMCLNNAAVAHLYCGNNEKFFELINKAKEVSLCIGDFGLDHVYINQVIYFLLKNKLADARQTLKLAQYIRERDATNLALDIVDSAYALKALPPQQALAKTEHIYDKCISGEFSYMLPCNVNYARALCNVGEYELAIKEMEKVTIKKVETIRYYIHCQESKWMKQLISLYEYKNELSKVAHLKNKYNWMNFELTANIDIYNCDFSAVPIQYCSL